MLPPAVLLLMVLCTAQCLREAGWRASGPADGRAGGEAGRGWLTVLYSQRLVSDEAADEGQSRW